MTIFDFTDYKDFFRRKIATFPKKGHGLLRKIGQQIGLSSVAVSQIFKGNRDLTLEQGLSISEFFNLTSLERDYFLLMIQRERAGNFKLKDLFSEKMAELRLKAQNLKDRLPKAADIGPEAKMIYYSNWVYSALRVTSLISGSQTIDDFSYRLGLSASEILKYMEFLVEFGICKKEGDRYSTGLGITHLEAQSPLAVSHHKNWRIKGIEKMVADDIDQIFFTLPMSLSNDDIRLIRKKIILLIEDVNKIVRESPSENTACLKIGSSLEKVDNRLMCSVNKTLILSFTIHFTTCVL